MKKSCKLLILALVLLFQAPQLIFAETKELQPKVESPKTPTNKLYQWDKIEEGLYQLSFLDNTNLTENEKLNTFFDALEKFKKDHSGEKIIGYQSLIDKAASPSINGFMVSTEKKAVNGAVLAAIITGITTGLIGLATIIYTIKNNKKTLFVNNITSERVKWMGKLKEYVAEFISLASFYNEKPVLDDTKEKGEYLDKIIHARAKIKLHLNYRGEEDKEIMQLVDKIASNIMKAYETFTFLKISDKEKIAYVIENHDEQLNQRIDKKVKKIMHESPESLPTDNEDFLKKFREIFLEAQHEEIALFNDKFKEDFRHLKEELQNNTDILLELTQKYLKEEWNRVKQEAKKGELKKK